jgi:hypothetical protein
MVENFYKCVESLRVRNSKNIKLVNRDLFKLLCDEDFLLSLVNEITIEKKYKFKSTELTSNYRYLIHDVITDLRAQKFEFINHELSNKQNSDNDKIQFRFNVTKNKIVEKGIVLILKSIYSPILSKYQSGVTTYKHYKQPADSLLEIKKTWIGLRWGVTGKIDRLNERIDSNILISIIRMKIQDDSFIQLIHKFLQFERSYKPQILDSSSISKILIDIYLHELDSFLEKLVIHYKFSYAVDNIFFDSELRKNVNRLTVRLAKSNLNSHMKSSKAYIPNINSRKSELTSGSKFVQIKVIRHIGWILVGVKGPRSFARLITAKIESYLSYNLNLTIWSEEPSFKRFSSGQIDFLGYKILCRNLLNSKLEFFIPRYRLINLLSRENFSNKLGDGIKKKGWILYSDRLIIDKYNRLIFKLKEYSFIASNYKSLVREINYIVKYSCAHTLASKHRTHVSFQLGRLKILGLVDLAP